jgi:hypothetical protein
LKTRNLAALLTLLVLLLSACAPITPEPAATSASADTASVSADAPSQYGAATPLPERIVFASGETTATRSGTVTPEFSPQYVIDILADQNVQMMLESGGSTASFSVIGVSDGLMYKSSADGVNQYSFRTTMRQDYLITIIASVPTEYNFGVYVEPLSYPTPVPSEIVQIQLAPGETSTDIPGTTVPYGIDRYRAQAQGGQNMTVSLQSEGSQLRFAVLDLQNGTVLERLNSPNPVWTGTLPATGQYEIDVVSNADTEVDYVLHVGFSPLVATAPTPQRITFAPGVQSAGVGGTVVPPNSTQFIVQAGAGQTMQISTNPFGSVGVSVYGADGVVLQSPMGGLPSFQGTLPSTQDYIISITSLTGGTVNFDMMVSLLQ